MDEIHIIPKGCYQLELLVCINLLILVSKSTTDLLEMSVCQLIDYSVPFRIVPYVQNWSHWGSERGLNSYEMWEFMGG